MPSAGPRRRIYAAYATSGVWKTDDDGASWQAVFENQPSTSIGDIAIAPSNPDIVWVGTGESNLFRASMPGVGVFKSTDGARTFQHSGLTDTQTVARIVVHPSNPDIVYVAAGGHGWTDNETRGVFKTVDGGRTWTKVLYRSPRTGAIDLVMDPSDPNTLYAAMWQRVRRKWSDPRVEPGYNESGIFKSTDAGSTWSDASAGLPPAQYRGRIGIDVSTSNPNVLYAFVDNYEEGRPPRENERDAYGRLIVESRIKAAEIYRTDDKGRTWRKVSASDDFMTSHSGTYGWVFGQIRVDPANENTIYTMGLNLNVSHDAGKTFTTLRGMHGDHHGLWIDPKEFVGVVQRQRRWILQVRRCREELAVRRVGRRVAVLQRRARHDHTSVGVRLDPGRWQQARARRHHEGARSHPAPSNGPRRLEAKAPIRPSIRRTPTSSIPTGSMATSRVRISG